VAREILDTVVYMTLGTADAAGRPWVSPVFFAADGYRNLYWISAPQATHSRNLAERPEASIVVFDSQAPVGTGQAVYMAVTADQVLAPAPTGSTGPPSPSTGSSTRTSAPTRGPRSPGRLTDVDPGPPGV
jgi:hypothetical protein